MQAESTSYFTIRYNNKKIQIQIKSNNVHFAFNLITYSIRITRHNDGNGLTKDNYCICWRTIKTNSLKPAVFPIRRSESFHSLSLFIRLWLSGVSLLWSSAPAYILKWEIPNSWGVWRSDSRSDSRSASMCPPPLRKHKETIHKQGGSINRGYDD